MAPKKCERIVRKFRKFVSSAILASATLSQKFRGRGHLCGFTEIPEVDLPPKLGPVCNGQLMFDCYNIWNETVNSCATFGRATAVDHLLDSMVKYARLKL